MLDSKRMRYNEIQEGVEYAVKADYAAKGALPMGVARVKVLSKSATKIVRVYHQFHPSTEKTVRNCIRVEVLEILSDPRPYASQMVASFGQGTRKERVEPGQEVVIENGREFVAPWDNYMEDRAKITNAKSEQEAAEWEAQSRQRMLGERLRALGFTSRVHGDVWQRKDYQEHADYTERGGRITTEALERLVTMAEASGLTAPEPGKPMEIGDDWDG